MTPEELAQKLKEYEEVKDSKHKVEQVLENLMNDEEQEDKFRVHLTLIPNPDRVMEGLLGGMFGDNTNKPEGLDAMIEGQYVYRVLSDAHRQFEAKYEIIKEELERLGIDCSEEQS